MRRSLSRLAGVICSADEKTTDDGKNMKKQYILCPTVVPWETVPDRIVPDRSRGVDPTVVRIVLFSKTLAIDRYIDNLNVNRFIDISITNLKSAVEDL